MSIGSTWIKNATLILASFIVALALGELALRAIGYSAPIWYQPDARLGWTLRPGLAGWWTREGRGFVEVNSAGLRDGEHALEKPAGTYRIAVLGDSYSEAFQLPAAQAYWALLPARLASCGLAAGKRIEVLNFGVSGYGTAQELLMLESRAIAYRPDLVLLQFTDGNDVADNAPTLADEKARPFFVLGRDGALELDDSFARSSAFAHRSARAAQWLRIAADHSRLAQLARAVRELPLMSGAQARDKNEKAGGIEQGLEAMVLARPRTPAWEDAWRVTEALLARTADYARSRGAQFVVVTVPYAAQVHPDRELRAALAAKLGVEDLFYPDRRIGEFAARHGIRAIALAPQMQRLADQRGTFFHGFENVGIGIGHWNAQGHRTAADLVARELCSLKSQPGASP
jgi:hypothetical protein